VLERPKLASKRALHSFSVRISSPLGSRGIYPACIALRFLIYNVLENAGYKINQGGKYEIGHYSRRIGIGADGGIIRRQR
jgi:hypothetical protein